MSSARTLLSLVTLLVAACATLPRVGTGGTVTKSLTFSILEDYDKGADLAAVARDFDLFGELGVSTWRGSFGWDDYEPERGRYDFAWLHDFIALAERRRVTLRPYVAYTPDWAAGGRDSDGQAWNQPPRDPEAWAAFVTALAKELRHHTNVPSLEIYNEQNVAQWWEGSRDDYARALIAASNAARAVEKLELLAGGLVFPDLEWIEGVCRAGAGPAFDVLPVHAYPETWTPPHVTVESYLGSTFGEQFARGVDRACGRKRIWINETGFATVPGKTEREQAAWWVRAIATFAAEPRVEHIGIYEIRDLAPDKPAIGDTPNYHLGLVRTDGTKKLAFHTVDVLTDLLSGGELTVAPRDFHVQRRAAAGELHHHGFRRRDGDGVLAIWNRTVSETLTVTAAGRYAEVAEYGLDGREIGTRAARELTVSLQAGIPRVFRYRRR